MRLGTKIVLLAVAILAGWILLTKTFDYLKEKHFYKFVANRFHAYTEKKWGADLYVGDVEGSILKDVSLKNIAVDKIKNLPPGFQIKADSLDLTYPPFGLLFGKFDGKFENLRLIYKDTVIPIDAYQHDGLAVIVIKKNSVNLSKLSDMLPQGSLLSGTLDIEGEIILKRLKLHLINISFNSKDFRLDYESSRKTRGSLKIEIVGKADNLRISGDIKVDRTNFYGGSSFFSLGKAWKFGNGFLRKASLDVIEEINVGRYKISAKVDGTGGNMRLTLSSKPELPYSDITSLLVFGKETKDLSDAEKDKLTRVNFSDSLVTGIFSF